MQLQESDVIVLVDRLGHNWNELVPPLFIHEQDFDLVIERAIHRQRELCEKGWDRLLVIYFDGVKIDKSIPDTTDLNIILTYQHEKLLYPVSRELLKFAANYSI